MDSCGQYQDAMMEALRSQIEKFHSHGIRILNGSKTEERWRELLLTPMGFAEIQKKRKK
jgi:hypothetical protein